MFKVYWNLEDVPVGQAPTVPTIGNFDGLHRGHVEILKRTKHEARRVGGEAVALTFDPHPTRVVAPERAPQLLMTPAERVRQFENHGLDAAVVLPFTPEIACLTPAEFVGQVLVEKLGARSIVVGEGFRFGHKQAGTLAVLTELGKDLGFETVGVRPVLVGGRAVSSTWVRELVLTGKVEQARRLLGRPFSLVGDVVPRTRDRLAPNGSDFEPRPGRRCAARPGRLRHLDVRSRHRETMAVGNECGLAADLQRQ